MTTVKISALPSATTPLAGTELLELVQSGNSTKVAASVIAATFSTDAANILPGTAGGTGQSSYAVGDLLYASTTTALSKLADVATGNALLSGGVGTAPAWGKVGLTTHVSGTLPVASGGTGAVTLTGYVKGTGTSAVTAAATVPVADISGTLTVAQGGTGAVTLTGYVKGTGTSAVTAAATVPVADISGTLTVAQGGTGAVTLTAGYLVKGAGTSAVTASVIYDDGNNVGIGTTSPAAGTILDIQSTTKGVRFPNMTTTQKNAMTGAVGAVVFDTTLGKLCVYNGAAWQTITSA